MEFFILSKHIGFDDDMEPYVKDADGKPARTNTGTPISLESFVKTYLDGHPAHRKQPNGQGGGARGGASFQRAGGDISLASAQERIHGGDRSTDAITDLINASTRRKAS